MIIVLRGIEHFKVIHLVGCTCVFQKLGGGVEDSVMISKEHPLLRTSILNSELKQTKSSGINSARLKESLLYY